MREKVTALFLWVALVTGAHAMDRLPPGATVVDPDASGLDVAATRDMVDAVLRELASGTVDAALARLYSETDALRFEHAAAAVIDALMQGAPAPEADRFLAALESAPVRVYVQHPETAADWFLPLYDVPGQAQSARRMLAQSRRIEALLERWSQGKVTLRESSAPDASTVVAAAIERAPESVISGLRKRALRSPEALSGQGWIELARRSADLDVLRAARNQAAPVELLPLVAEVARSAPADVAFGWLVSLEDDARYASAAVMGLGMLAPRSKQAESRLYEHLAREGTGKSAAAALASLAVPDRIARLDRALDAARDPVSIKHLALALRLEGSEAARARLQRLLTDERLAESARKELQR